MGNSEQATISIRKSNKQFLHDQGISLSTFVNQQIEAVAASKSNLRAMQIARQAQYHREELQRCEKELKALGIEDIELLSNKAVAQAVQVESSNFEGFFGAITAAYKPKEIIDMDKSRFILAWIESRSKDWNLTRPPGYLLEQVRERIRKQSS